MFCFKCGSQLEDGIKFCDKCGAQQVSGQPEEEAPALQEPPLQPTYTPPQQYSQQPSDITAQELPFQPPVYIQPKPEGAAAAPLTKRSKKKYIIGGSVAAAVILVAVAAVLIVPLLFGGSALSRAMSTMQDEMSQRIDNSPLKSVMMLGDIMEDGKLVVNFDYSETYEDWWSGDMVTDGARGSVTLASDSENRDLYLGLDLDIIDSSDSFNLNMEAFINNERAALGMKDFSSNYYGITYSTFRSDIRSFGDLFGIDSGDLDPIADLVEMLDELLNMPDDDLGDYAPYAELMTGFFAACEQSSERSGGINKITITITKDAIMSLLDGYYDLLEDDDNIRSSYNSMMNFSGGYNTPSYNDFLREYRDVIREFDRTYSDSSTIDISFSIGSGSRITYIELDANMSIDGERITFRCTADFGESITDRWDIRVVYDGETVLRIVWDYNDSSSRIDNTIRITADYETITLKSLWSPDSGRFTLSASDDYDDYEITGTFTSDDNNFRLKFDNFFESMNDDYYDYGDSSFELEIVGSKGAGIKSINYVNLDRWDEALVEDLEDYFERLFW